MEEWKKINSYPRYMISNQGRVMSMVGDPYRILKPRASPTGYLFVQLCRGSEKPMNHSLHRLVADHFLKKEDRLIEVNHKNGVKADNGIENLEFVSRSTNIKHAYALGLKKPVRLPGEQSCLAVLNDKAVIEIRSLYKSGMFTQTYLAKTYAVHQGTIHCIVARKTWRHI